MAKYCPHCGDFFLYDDSQTSCPDCNRPLVPYQQASAQPQSRDTAAQSETREAPAQPRRSSSNGTAGGAGGFSQFSAGEAPPDRSRPNSGQQQERTWNRAAPQQPQNGLPAFLVQEGGRYIFRGAVFHVDTLVREYGFLRKVFYCVFAGEPFQLGRACYLTNIRIEEHTDTGYPERSETVVYYGDIESQLATGDDVQLECVRRRGRYMAARIYSFDHNRPLSPESVRVPVWLVRVLFFAAVFLLFAFTAEVVNFFVSGAFLALLSQLMLPLIIIGVLWFWLRSRRWR